MTIVGEMMISHGRSSTNIFPSSLLPTTIIIIILNTGTTNFSGTSNKADDNPGLQSALRYFQGLSASADSSSTSTPTAANNITTTTTTTSAYATAEQPSASLLSSLAISIPPPPPPPPSNQPMTYQERKLRELVSL